jgi:Domain of unknown function (DUF6089)
MRKFLFSAIMLLTFTSSFAQYKKEFGGCLGMSNYLGDIGGGIKEGRQNSFLDLRWQQTRFTLNGYFRYKLTKDFSLRSSLIYTRLSGDDKNSTNKQRVTRNLSFKTDLTEIMQTIEWNFFQQTKMSPRTSIVSKGGKKRLDFRAYFFTGFGAIFFNPRAELNGKMYNLRALQTEGVKYSPISWSAPLGLGFAYTLNKTIRLGMDVSYRFTGTDYLDDVSGNYKLNSYYDSENNPTDPEKALANRTPEVQNINGLEKNKLGVGYNPALMPGGNYNDYIDKSVSPNVKTGSFRGSNSDRDGYFLLNITAGYVIKGKNKYYKSKYRNIVNRRKVVKKKTRAKF